MGPGGGVLAAVVVGAAEWAWIRVQGRMALRSLGAVRLHPQEAPRLFNLAEGLAPVAGIEVPSLWLIRHGGPNALVCRRRGPVIAVTRTMLDGYTRTELEAVVAHCFVRLRDVGALAEAVALGPLGDKIVPSVGISHDAAAAALTRYPPAMARAIAKAEARSDRFSAIWFAGEDAFHDSERARTDMLLDL
jgi:Zn-dependent protease with chaperone function